MGISFRSPRDPVASPRAAAGPGYALRRVASRDDWANVCALRLAAASSREGIPLGAADDGPDAARAAATYLLTWNGQPVGATRSRHARAGEPFPLASLQAFARDLDAAFGDAMVVEASHTVVDPSVRDRAMAMVRLFKAHLLDCAVRDADWLVAAVPDTRIGFYRRMFDMEILSGAEHVPGTTLPRVLMGLRFRERAPVLFRRLPLLAFDGADQRRFAADGEIRFEEEAAGAALSPAGEPCG